VNSISESKSELRRKLRGILKEMTSSQRAEQSERAIKLLRSRPEWREARMVALYAPLSTEMDLSPLLSATLEEAREIAIPSFDVSSGKYLLRAIQNHTTDCVVGQFGILEPASHCAIVPGSRLDLILVPGLGFDKNGGRLGRGKGYYDRLLQECSGLRCGCAFEEQLIPQIPMESHDLPMHCLLTPEHWFVCQPPEHAGNEFR
jgi:5-formyltetrahydrofolate cyclo-ligase